MTARSGPLWRVIPWDPAAQEGEPFSASYVPPLQGKGRFDLPGHPGGVLYLAESPEHAVAERIQHFRGHEVDDDDLKFDGHRLALVQVTIPARLRTGIVDLCDARNLTRLKLAPDALASRDRRVTQRIAADIRAAGYAGLRWWSALSGDWHTIVVFLDRGTPRMRYGEPAVLDLSHPAVVEAAHVLGIRLRDR